MTNDEAIKYLKQLYPNGGHCWLDTKRMEAIEIAVKAIKIAEAASLAYQAWCGDTMENVQHYMNELGKKLNAEKI